MHSQQSMDYFRTLYEVVKAVNSSLNPRTVLRQVAEKVSWAMDVKACSIRLLSEDRQYLLAGATYGLSQQYLRKGKVEVDKSKLDQEVLHGHNVYVCNACSDDRFQYPEAAQTEGIASVMAVPLNLQGQEVIGVLRVYSNIERGTLELENREFDLQQLITNCTASYRHLAEQQGLTLSTKFLGEWPEHPAVLGDASRLRQILAGLIDNAIKFTGDGYINVVAGWFPLEDNCGGLNCTVRDLVEKKTLKEQIDPENYVSDEMGLPTLKDIMAELEKPGRDPRKQIKAFQFDRSIRSIEDLKEGMVLPGIVNNITNFGAFVDIGIKHNGLIHISNLANQFVSNPADFVKLHQQIRVKVVNVDVERGRIQLSLKDVGE